MTSRGIAVFVWALALALSFYRLADDRVSIMFDPATDGPIRLQAPTPGTSSSAVASTRTWITTAQPAPGYACTTTIPSNATTTVFMTTAGSDGGGGATR